MEMNNELLVTYTIGDNDTRPWGIWEVLGIGNSHIVKMITVMPGQLVSLQRHQFRAEHRIVVNGKASVTLNKETFELKADQPVYLPKTFKHRIDNYTDESLCSIEVKIAGTLDENDIERFEDQYGRASE